MEHLIEPADSNAFRVQNDFLMINGSRDTVSHSRDHAKSHFLHGHVTFQNHT